MSTPTSKSDTRLMEIVLVEDERADVLLLQRALTRGGLANPVRVLSDGEQALEYLLGSATSRPTAPDAGPGLILLDLKLPRVDGLAVLRCLKEDAVVKRVPVVVLTSSARSQDVRKAYDLGANSYLVKPSRFADLCDLAEQLKAYWLGLNRFADRTLD